MLNIFDRGISKSSNYKIVNQVINQTSINRLELFNKKKAISKKREVSLQQQRHINLGHVFQKLVSRAGTNNHIP